MAYDPGSPKLVRADPSGARRERARQGIAYGRRGHRYLFGAFVPATGEAFTHPYPRRTTTNWVAFLEQMEARLDPTVPRVYAVLDNLPAHRATDVLLWALAHPHWESVFQPKCAAYLNLIEPWCKVQRSLAHKGRRFAAWEEVCQAVETATWYWNVHRHPFLMGPPHTASPRPSQRDRLPPGGSVNLPVDC